MAFKIVSINVRGLRNPVKRKAIFAHIRNLKADVCLLQETHSVKNDEIFWPSYFKEAKFYFSHSTSRSAGVITLILIKKITVKDIFTDSNGRLLICKIESGGAHYTIVYVYGHNDRGQANNFFHESKSKMMSMMLRENVLMDGDFNQTWDTLDSASGTRPTAVPSLVDLKINFNLSDIWRDQHPVSIMFTWGNYSNTTIASRFDFS